MNIFILTTGRSGSVSFITACGHIANYSSSHESRSNRIGADHFRYPPNHIEADNRLSWFLGPLEEEFGDEALYVHLLRDRNATAKSFLNRYDTGIIKAYSEDILLGSTRSLSPLHICQDYYDTVNSNITVFLKNKSNVMRVYLENIENDFPLFWKRIGAEGDFKAAMTEWSTPKNVTAPPKINGCNRALKRFRDIGKIFQRPGNKN